MSGRYRRPDFRNTRGYVNRYNSAGSRPRTFDDRSRIRDRRINESRKLENISQSNDREKKAKASRSPRPSSYHGHLDSSKSHGDDRTDKEERKHEYSRDRTSAVGDKAIDRKNDSKSEGLKSVHDSRSRNDNTSTGTSITRQRKRPYDTKTESKNKKHETRSEIKPKVANPSRTTRTETVSNDKAKRLNVSKVAVAKVEHKNETRPGTKVESNKSQAHSETKSKEKKSERSASGHRKELPEKSVSTNRPRQTGIKRPVYKPGIRTFSKLGRGGFRTRTFQKPGDPVSKTFGGRSARTLTKHGPGNRLGQPSATHQREREKRHSDVTYQSEHKKHYHEDNQRGTFSKTQNEFHRNKVYSETEAIDRERYNENFDNPRISFHMEEKHGDNFDSNRRIERSYDREMTHIDRYDRSKERQNERSYDQEPRQEASYVRGGRQDGSYDRGRDREPRQDGSYDRGRDREPRQDGSYDRGRDREPRQDGSYDRGRDREPRQDGRFDRGMDREPRQDGSYDRGRRQGDSYDRNRREEEYNRGRRSFNENQFDMFDQEQGQNYDREHRHVDNYDSTGWNRDTNEQRRTREERHEYGDQGYYETDQRLDEKHERLYDRNDDRNKNDDRNSRYHERNDKIRNEHYQDKQYEHTRKGLDSERHYSERHSNVQDKENYKKQYHERRYEESSDLRGKRDDDFRNSYEREKRHEIKQRNDYHGRKNENHGESRQNLRRQKAVDRVGKSLNVNSRSQQYYRNTKRKFLTRKFHTQARNKHNEKYQKKAKVEHRSERESQRKGDSERNDSKNTDRPKAMPQVDRGASGCLLKEDRPYEERQDEGFKVHMDPPRQHSVNRERETGESTNIETVQQPMILIPNPDGRQTIDQFGNIIQLPDAGQALASIPIQNVNGQEMIFIPFTGNTVMPENIIQVQQAGFPVGFVPQMIPPNEPQGNIRGRENKHDETEKDSRSKNDVKHSTKKMLSSGQKAKLRTKLNIRRKENLVKEVEKKVLENLDKKSIVSQGTRDESGSKTKKITKKDAKGQNIYDDVSELDDVSDLEDVSDEDEDGNVSDWDKASIDEIELDANERRPKFRKQNEPRTLVQHSITRRKLNVRRGPVSNMNQSKIENKPEMDQSRRQGDRYRQPQLVVDRANVSAPVRMNARDMVGSSQVRSSMRSEIVKVEHEKVSATDKPVFKAYTASRISEELKRIDNENKKKNQQERRTLTIKSIKSNLNDDKARNIRDQRPISPLQVTVRNNLYEKKDNISDNMSSGTNQFDVIDNRSHSGQSKNVNKFQSKYNTNSQRHNDDRNATDTMFEPTNNMDKRIIRETTSGYTDVNAAQTSGFQDRHSHNDLNDTESSLSHKNDRHEINQRNIRQSDSSRIENKARNFKRNERDTGEQFGQNRDKGKFSANGNDSNSGIEQNRQRGEPSRKDRTDHRDSGFRGGRRSPPRYRENRNRESHKFEQHSTASETRFNQRQRSDRRDERDTDVHGEDRKRGFHNTTDEDLRQGVSPMKKMRDVRNEDDFDKETMNRRDGSLGFRGGDPVDMNASLVEQQGNDRDMFNSSQPTVQPMAPPLAPPLPDMSLPPPQLMRNQYVPTSQVVIQTPPLLGQPTQLQNVQQPQIIGLQQSQPMQNIQNQSDLQQQRMSFQPQSAGMQQSFQQLAQQSNLGMIQQQSGNQQLQFQTSDMPLQSQQRSYQIVIDHSQPMIHQLGPQQNVSGQQQIQPQIIHTNVQQSQAGPIESQFQNVNQSGGMPNQQRQQGQIVTNQNPFQNVQQTLNTLGINQGSGMQARIVSIGQGQNIIQEQMGGQTQQRGYLVPSSYSGNPQGFNKVST